MKIEKVQEAGNCIYHIQGRIDTQTAPDLQDMLEEGFKNKENNLVLDLNGVEYVSSAGLRSVLYAQKAVNSLEGSSMKIVGVNPEVMEVFEMTGFTDFLDITPTIA